MHQLDQLKPAAVLDNTSVQTLGQTVNQCADDVGVLAAANSVPLSSASPAVQQRVDNLAVSAAAECSLITALILAPEIGGREGPEPTRFGDWERAGRCIDF